MRPVVRLGIRTALVVAGLAVAACGVSMANGGWPRAWYTVDCGDCGPLVDREGKPIEEPEGGIIRSAPVDRERHAEVWIFAGVMAVGVGVFWSPDKALPRRRSTLPVADRLVRPRGRPQDAPADGETV